MRVLVLDGNENQAVACVRSLARAGHHVEVGADTGWSKAAWSRRCAGSFRYPSPDIDVPGFVDAIHEQAAREPGTLVLPMTERSTLPLSSSRERLAAACARIVLPAHDILLRAFDKAHTTQLARALGIPVPQTVVFDTASDVRADAAALPYPVVLKPRSSQETQGAGLRATGAPVYARNAEQFINAFEETRGRCAQVLVQEFVEGHGAGYFAIAQNGEVRREFAHRRLRDIRPTGSGSALRVSAAVDPVLGAHARRLLEALEWHGVAMVEFKVKRDGTPVFLELNGRFWNSLALAIHAGVDFPVLLARLAEHGDIGSESGYRVGVRCRWLLGDIRHLIEVWRGAPPGYPGEFPSRLGTLLRVLSPVPGTAHDNFTLDDPWPEVGDWLHFVARKLPRARRARAPEAQHV